MNNPHIFDNLSLVSGWLIFVSLLIVVVFSAVLIPKFLISFLGLNGKNVIFLSVFLLSLITSIPEILTTFLLPVWSISKNDGVNKSFAHILWANILIGSFFCIIFGVFFQKLKRCNYSLKIKYTTIMAILLTFYILLIFALPEQFVAFKIGKITIVSLFFVISYWIFILLNTFWKKKKTFNTEEVKINLFFYKKRKSVLFVWTIILIHLLVFGIFFLIRITEHLQNKHNFSNTVFAGFFFAFVNATPEIWTYSGLAYYGFYNSALGVIVGSYLFNFVIFLTMELFLEPKLWTVLLKEKFEEKLIWICFMIAIVLLLAQLRIFHQGRNKYALIPSLLIGSYGVFIFL